MEPFLFVEIFVQASLLAQAELATSLGKIVGTIQLISMVLTLSALVLAGVMFSLGRTESIVHALIGAAVCGTAWILTKTLFGASGTAVQEIVPSAF